MKEKRTISDLGLFVLPKDYLATERNISDSLAMELVTRVNFISEHYADLDEDINEILHKPLLEITDSDAQIILNLVLTKDFIIQDFERYILQIGDIIDSQCEELIETSLKNAHDAYIKVCHNIRAKLALAEIAAAYFISDKVIFTLIDFSAKYLATDFIQELIYFLQYFGCDEDADNEIVSRCSKLLVKIGKSLDFKTNKKPDFYKIWDIYFNIKKIKESLKKFKLEMSGQVSNAELKIKIEQWFISNLSKNVRSRINYNILEVSIDDVLADVLKGQYRCGKDYFERTIWPRCKKACDSYPEIFNDFNTQNLLSGINKDPYFLPGSLKLNNVFYQFERYIPFDIPNLPQNFPVKYSHFLK